MTQPHSLDSDGDGAATPTLRDVIAVLDAVYPRSLAADWDAVGLVSGDLDVAVSKVLLTVDVTDVTVDEALEARADLLLVHHPLFLRPVHGVGTDTTKGRLLHRLAAGGCALFTAHTNADAAAPGVSDALARVLGLTDLTPLEPVPADAEDKLVLFAPAAAVDPLIDALSALGAGATGQASRQAWFSQGTATAEPKAAVQGLRPERVTVGEMRIEMTVPRTRRASVVRVLGGAEFSGSVRFDLVELAAPDSSRGLGRVGTLRAATTLRSFVDQVVRALPRTLSGVRIAGPMDAPVHRVAVCGGAGDGLIGAARAAAADVFVTADLRHHVVSESVAGGPPWIIDVAHWASEWPWLLGARERLLAGLDELGQVVDARVSATSTDPWTARL